MSIPGSATPLLLATTAAEAAAAYQVDRSLRFNSGDSASLSTTVPDITTFSFSFWYKYVKADRNDIFVTDASTGFFFYQHSDGTFRVNSNSGALFTSNGVYRDPSAWYHVLITNDGTNFKLYVNGALDKSVAMATRLYSGGIYIGRDRASANNYGDFFLTEAQFIDGQALAPTDFGEYDDNNNWNPKEFSGTYSSGVDYLADLTINGTLYTDGDDPANAFDGSTSTQVQLNNNAQNQTITFAPAGGISYTSSVEVYIRPSGNTSVTRYSVNGGSDQSVSGTDYWQTILSGSGTFNSFVMKQMAQSNSVGFAAIRVDGTILVQGTGFNSFYLPFSDNSSNAALGYDHKETVTLNPDGGMDVVTYTGNGSTQDISGLGFQPDFVWLKLRNTSGYSHKLVDSVRGATKSLVSNNTNGELTEANGLTSFNSDGFSLGSQEAYNRSGNTFVAWAWKAGGAAGSNTDGSLNSQVSVSTDYGFSVVKYTAGSGSQNDTVGHGLGAVPKWILLKRLGTDPFVVSHTTLSTGEYLELNSTSGIQTSASCFPTAHTSSVFGIGTDGRVNAGGNSYIAYCWSEVSGFSKFGSYAGDGGTQKITTGFKPRFLLIKSYDTASNWHLLDSERGSAWLEANGSGSETSNSNISITYLDNGFTVNGSNVNASNANYLYAAFADRPGNNWAVNNLIATTGNTISASSVSLTAPSGGFLSGRDSKTYAIDGDTSSYLLANNSGDNYSVNFSPGITVNSSVEIYGLTSGQSASTNLSSATSYTSGQYTTIYSGSGTLTQITMIASGNRPGLAAIKVDGVLLIGTDDESDIDSLIDTPTNYEAESGNNGGNYATLNPLYRQNGTLSNGNLDFNVNVNPTNIFSSIAMSSGKYYVELNCTNVPGNYHVGVMGVNNSPTTVSNRLIVRQDGNVYNATTQIATVSSFTTGDVIGVAFDADNRQVYFYKNGSSLGGPYSPDGSLDSFYIHFRGGTTGATGSFNFGQRAFAYTPPTGYKSLCATNLTDPTIADGSTVMDATTYTGAAGTQTISGISHSPDFVWIKSRSIADQHCLFDTVRGTLARLQSNSTNVEATVNQYGSLTAFNNDGFTLTAGSAGSDQTHGSSKTYVAWTWDAGSSTVSNTDGSITSNVRANASAGFSIVSYTADGTNSTVGHGLNAAPELVIIKGRNSIAENWKVYHKSYGTNGSLHLNLTTQDTSSTAFNQTAPTNSVFSIGIHSASNQNTKNYIAYCFAPVAGYSAFGSYTGNGNADGPFVYTGFRPAFILIKGSSFTSNWFIQDYARDGYNVNDGVALRPNLANAEDGTATYNLDILSNGFKLRTSSADSNTNNATFVWAAFASHPFKTARAR